MVNNAGGEVRRSFTIVDAMAISVPEPAIQGLARNPRVEYIEEDPKVDVLHSQTVPWGVARVFGYDEQANLQGTWAASGGGDGVKVAVLDTGIDPNHPDFEVAGGWDFVEDRTENEHDEIWEDLHGHGTHVAGTIAAKENEFGVVGVAPHSEIYAFRVVDDNGQANSSDIAAGVEAAWQEGIHIINMSLGSLALNTVLLQSIADAANQHNILLIASAGNDFGTDTVNYPAKYADVIAVAASDMYDQRANFTSGGPEVDFIAPGVGVLSTIPFDGPTQPFWDVNNTPGAGSPHLPSEFLRRYAYMNGTSMAAPHVAGVAALIWSHDPTLENWEVHGILEDTAEDINIQQHFMGHGLVRADWAIEDDSFVATPARGARVVWGQEHTITARWLDSEGDGVSGMDVEFEVVEGPNMGEGTGNWPETTNSLGEATWSYSATTTTPGIDKIEVSFDTNPSDPVVVEVTCMWINEWEMIELDPGGEYSGPFKVRGLNSVSVGDDQWTAQVVGYDCGGAGFTLEEELFSIPLDPPENEPELEAWPVDINNASHNYLAVGWIGTENPCYWPAGSTEAVVLSVLHINHSDGRAVMVNDKGVIVGYALDSQGRPRAVVWEPDFHGDPGEKYFGLPRDLGEPPGEPPFGFWEAVVATAVNENGIVVGASRSDTGEWEAFRSDATNGIPNQLSAGSNMRTASGEIGHQSIAYDIDVFGGLVGASHTASGDWLAMYKEPGSGGNTWDWSCLGALGEEDSTEARAINDRGLIVGNSFGGENGRRGFVTAIPEGFQEMHDLNERAWVEAGSGSENVVDAGWTIVRAWDINERNWIVAEAVHEESDTPRAVLLKPGLSGN